MAGKEKPSQKPWERQDEETGPAFEAFLTYRDLGPGRTFAAVVEKLQKSDTLIHKWKKEWNWRERADAWDAELDRQRREELGKGITEMRKTHVAVARAMLTKAQEALEKIPLKELTAQDITRMVDIAAKLERISRGEVTERTEGKQTIAGEVRTEAVLEMQNLDLSVLTNGELDRLGELVEKLASDR